MSQTNPTDMPGMKLELVPLPVSDIERAKAFYVEKLGFHADHDIKPNDTMRVVQLTPPGSACSIAIGTGIGTDEMQPGSIRGLHLVVPDVGQVRAILVARGVAVSEVVDMGGVKYAYLSDPDGNTWALQEIPGRAW
jgi:catechol 2,3-dioxygenase-like lactoylglutathione lyase family enzyme